MMDRLCAAAIICVQPTASTQSSTTLADWVNDNDLDMSHFATQSSLFRDTTVACHKLWVWHIEMEERNEPCW
jgi:hypothetical protein